MAWDRNTGSAPGTPDERATPAEPRRAAPHFRFSTDVLPGRDRFEAWRALVGATHDISADDAGFFGQVATARLDRMLVHVMDASPQQVQRTQRQIRRDGLEHFVLHLSVMALQAEAAGQAVAIPAEAISVNDLSRPSWRQKAPESRSVIVSLSRDLVAEALPDTDGLHGLVLAGGTGALLRDYLRSLAANIGDIPVAAAGGIADATARLFAACAGPTRDTVERARGPLDAAALVRAKRYIEGNLRSPALSPESVRAAAGVSRTTLFRLFGPLGGVAGYIRERRLAAVRRALAVPSARRRIAEIGYAHGFTSDVHLSRAFRRSFGMTPSEFAFGAGDPALPRPARDGAGEAFGEWLRTLG